ncbi:carbon-nitrogen hydrolase family protein [Nonomuraea sp. NPDC026600]|uniref:carbon-nitrogen hydrolase family protein n=1 Tax=Nonomuraea sp. NPDC026600 TaxID=3155363 RepID=UPI0033CC5A6E
MRVAALQSELEGWQAGGLHEAIKLCERQKAELLVLPECYFGGMRSARPAADAVAMTAPYPDLVAAFRDCPAHLTVVAGFTERAADGLLFSSAAVVRGGQLLGVVRKLFPREPAFTPGEEVPLFYHDQRAFGVVICNDANFVEPSRLLALAGARILACPLNNDLPVEVTRGWRVRTRSALIARAVENDCWVIAADVCGRAEGRQGGAATRIIAPDGRIMSETDGDEPGVVVADIDLTNDSMLQRWDVAQNPAIFGKWIDALTDHAKGGRKGQMPEPNEV